ncbi:MAG: hypothetical protein ACREIT_05270, partial [Tepidisphaeraceae bacterium]
MALPPPDDPERRLAVARRWCIAFALPHLLFAAFAVGLTVYFLMYEGDYAGIILGIGGMVSAAATLPGIMALVVG